MSHSNVKNSTATSAPHNPLAPRLARRPPGDQALKTLGRQVWQAWVEALAAGHNTPFLSHVDEHAPLYFPLGGRCGRHWGLDAIAAMFARVTECRESAPLFVHCLYHASRDNQTIVFEFADRSDQPDSISYENGLLMSADFRNGELIKHRAYLSSVSPALMPFARGRYSEAGLGAFDFRSSAMASSGEAAAGNDEQASRKVADQALTAIDLFRRTGRAQALLDLMTPDVAFWYPAGKWRGLTTGKDEVAVLLEDLSIRPPTEIDQIFSVTQNGGTVVYETGVRLVGGTPLTQIAWSIDVVSGKVAAIRGYLGDANQIYLERQGALFD